MLLNEHRGLDSETRTAPQRELQGKAWASQATAQKGFWAKYCKWHPSYQVVDECNRFGRCLRAWAAQNLPFQNGLNDRPRPLELNEVAANRVAQMRTRARPDDVISISILGTGNLSDEPDIIHPIVRAHLVDPTSGRYLVPSTKSSCQGVGGLTTYHEQASALRTDSLKYATAVEEMDVPVEHVLPIATAPCHLQGRSIAPVWNESCVINLPYRDLLDPNVLILFEIVDFNHIQSHSTHREHTDGLYGLAWAYLQPVGLHGDVYVGTRGSIPKGQKLTGATGAGDDEAKLSIRLQLYDYKSLSPSARYTALASGISAPPAPASPRVPAVYLQYLRKGRARYPSTLLVRIHPISRPHDHEVSYRPTQPNQKEVSDICSVASQPKSGIDAKTAASRGMADARSLRATCRQRYASEGCVLPDRLLCRIHSGSHGALTIQFSPTGRLLAVASVESLVCPIRLYDAAGHTDGAGIHLPSAATACAAYGLQVDCDKEGALLLADLDGHHGLIYDLRFTADERFLLSASADGLAKIWDLGSLAALPDPVRPSRAPQILCIIREPSGHYIYAAAFVAMVSRSGAVVESVENRPPGPGQGWATRRRDDSEVNATRNVVGHQQNPDIIAKLCPPILTGAYSGALAYWDPGTGSSLGLLGGEIVHDGRVHCIEVDQRSGRIYSGDSTGAILVWRRNGDGNCVSHFVKARKIEHAEFKCKPIMSMQLHPKCRRGQLLVQAQACTLKLFDLTTAQPVAHYKGNVVNTALIRAKFSPDGNIIMAGSEDGKVYAWDTKSTTPILLPMAHVGYNAPLCDLTWHPTQHVVAYTCYGGDHPILLCFSHRPENPRYLLENSALGAVSHLDEDRAAKRKERLRELQMRRRGDSGLAI